MKNFSIQMAETTPFKKASEAMNKSNQASDNPTSIEQKSPFQMMLNKQVQAKQAQVKPVTSQQNQAPKILKKLPAKPDNSEVAVLAQDSNSQNSTNAKHVAKGASKNDLETDELRSTDSKLAAQPTFELNVKPVKTIKKDDDTQIEEILNKPIDTDNQVNVTLLATTVSPMVSIIPQGNQHHDSTSPVNDSTSPVISDELSATSEEVTQKQRNMDKVLSNVLLSGKNTAPVVPEVQIPEVSTETDSSSKQQSWIEAMLPNTAKQSISNELLSGKNTAPLASQVQIPEVRTETDSSSNQQSWIEAKLPSAAKQSISDEFTSTKNILKPAKDDLVKDAGVKDITATASFQPSVKVNAAEAIQQAGSSNVINAYPGKSGWDQAISQKVVWMLRAQEQTATLTLNPPDMGPLQVVIHVHNDQADTTFISDNANVRQALQDGMANLRDKMNESGIQLGQANVNSGSQMQQQFQQASQKNGIASNVNTNSQAPSAETITTTRPVVRVANGLVDTFV
jgi:flagellar hook-length control protein FliK